MELFSRRRYESDATNRVGADGSGSTSTCSTSIRGSQQPSAVWMAAVRRPAVADVAGSKRNPGYAGAELAAHHTLAEARAEDDPHCLLHVLLPLGHGDLAAPVDADRNAQLRPSSLAASGLHDGGLGEDRGRQQRHGDSRG